MAKISLPPLSGGYASVTAINARLQQIEDAFNDDVLWRDGFVGEDNTMNNELDMNGYSIINSGAFNSNDLYLGAFNTAPTEFSPGVPLSTAHTGALYFNTTDNSMYVWTGTVWSSLSSAATTAAAVTITDTDGHYTGTSVEDALKELGDTTGAGIVQIADTSSYFTSTNVEDALAELYEGAVQSSTDNITVSTPTSGQQTFTDVPAWANTITMQFEDLQFLADNNSVLIRAFAAGGSVKYQGLCINELAGLVVSDQTYNYVRVANGKTGIPGWWSGTVTFKRKEGHVWNVEVNLSEMSRAGTGASNYGLALGSVIHLGTAAITSIEFGNFSTINECNVTIKYEA